MHRLYFHISIVLALAGIVPVVAWGQFIRVGSPETYLMSMSADGTIAVGTRGNYGPAWRWTASTGVVDIGGDGFQARISRDGKTIVSNAKDANGVSSAAIWLGDTRWKNLGGIAGGRPTDNVLSTAYSVSGDGSVITGLAWGATAADARGFRWTSQDGMVDLGSLQGRYSRASVVSGDGNVILGWDEDPSPTEYDSWRGAMWWQGLERLMHPYGWIGQVEGTNLNGTVFVGKGLPGSPKHAYRMDAWGNTEDLGALKRSLVAGIQEREDQSWASAVSDDGNVVVGESGYQPPTDAFLWTPATKMVKLTDYLTKLGLTGFDGWTLIGVGWVSPDGKILGGTGINPDGRFEGYIVKLP